MTDGRRARLQKWLPMNSYKGDTLWDLELLSCVRNNAAFLTIEAGADCTNESGFDDTQSGASLGHTTASTRRAHNFSKVEVCTSGLHHVGEGDRAHKPIRTKFDAC